jgi:hypothetical protein
MCITFKNLQIWYKVKKQFTFIAYCVDNWDIHLVLKILFLQFQLYEESERSIHSSIQLWVYILLFVGFFQLYATKSSGYSIKVMNSHYPDDEGSKLLCNFGQYIPDYTVLHPRRQPPSHLLYLKPQISQINFQLQK